MRFRGRHRKTTFGENGKNKTIVYRDSKTIVYRDSKTIVYRDSEHRIVTPQSKSATLQPADFTQGHAPEYPNFTKEMI